MTTPHDATTPLPADAGTPTPGPAASSDRIRLAVAYNDALDRCIQIGGEHLDELMALLAWERSQQ